MHPAWRALVVAFFAFGLVAASGWFTAAQAKPSSARSAHPAKHHLKRATGAQRRQTWRNSRMDLKKRFHTLGQHLRRPKK